MSKKYFSIEAMNIAVQEAYEGIEKNHGGPFGAVIINPKTNEIIGKGHNHVLDKHDPTCHGEMEAIRDACKKLGTHDLSGYDIYTTGEPCPMCLGAIMWANINNVYYGCNKEDTNKIGFRDEDFYKRIKNHNIGIEHEEFRKLSIEVYKHYEKLNRKRY